MKDPSTASAQARALHLADPSRSFASIGREVGISRQGARKAQRATDRRGRPKAGRETIQLTLPPDVASALREQGQRDGVTIGALVEAALLE